MVLALSLFDAATLFRSIVAIKKGGAKTPLFLL